MSITVRRARTATLSAIHMSFNTFRFLCPFFSASAPSSPPLPLAPPPFLRPQPPLGVLSLSIALSRSLSSVRDEFEAERSSSVTERFWLCKQNGWRAVTLTVILYAQNEST
ncbi:unnamed protein product [Cyclocybe aegerita]|uniref:Uncharacterized protein n=1 Tax=Cyclocybe aegerita TaxID=1973307 RepID=A0A8S0WCN0_CYCAE|nr:unnamed protein product [Cyclocybe aegerita]